TRSKRDWSSDVCSSDLVLYPGLSQPEPAYMRIVAEHLPHALRGVVFAGFMAAFMSTVATQLNWGASYLVADFYRRFVKRDGTEKIGRASCRERVEFLAS